MATNSTPDGAPPATDAAVQVEFLVEPFVEGDPGPHVTAALEACREHGLDPELGPFASTVEGPPDLIASLTGDLTGRALAAGATGVQIRVTAAAGSPQLGNLHGALERMVARVETQLGACLADMNREQKQAAVRILDEQGAFLLRKSVESVGELMGVSRITIYNYLNAIGLNDRASSDRASDG